MNGFMCGPGLRTEKLPATPGFCCIDDYEDGPQACTCWTEVYDPPVQQPVREGLPLPPIPVAMCDGSEGGEGCAYRPHSPERSGDESYQGSEGELTRLVETGTPFYCHRGMVRAVRLRHPSGMEIDAHPGGYRPPVIGGVPYKADGSPADICGGWLLLRAKATEKAAS